MKLSAETITILENFAEINSNLQINVGNQLSTARHPISIIANAQVNEVFEQSFAIYDLKKFLSILSMFKNPTLTFNQQFVDIVDEDDPNIRTKYWGCEPELLSKVPVLTKQLPDPDAVFDISKINFNRIQAAVNVLKCEDVFIKTHGNTIVAEVCNAANRKDVFTLILSHDYNGQEFNVHLKHSKITIIPGDYQCELIAYKMIKLTHKTCNVQYYITLEAD